MEHNYIEEQEYIKAKKKVKEIKDFYMHLTVMIFALPIVITVNLMFVPNFYFFWLAAFGMLFSVAIHWLQVFGFSKLGLSNFTEEHKYLLAKKRVEKIKGFYIHFAVYIIVNIFISAIIIYGLTNDSDGEFGFYGAITHFGTYATWFFWGIGLFFHWLGVFGTNLFFGPDWEKKKIKKYMNEHKF